MPTVQTILFTWFLKVKHSWLDYKVEASRNTGETRGPESGTDFFSHSPRLTWEPSMWRSYSSWWPWTRALRRCAGCWRRGGRWPATAAASPAANIAWQAGAQAAQGEAAGTACQTPAPLTGWTVSPSAASWTQWRPASWMNTAPLGLPVPRWTGQRLYLVGRGPGLRWTWQPPG